MLKILDQFDKKNIKLTNYDRARIHSRRAVALANSGNSSEAIKEHNKAIATYSTDPVLYETRASYWRAHGYSSRAAADMAKAREIRKKQKK